VVGHLVDVRPVHRALGLGVGGVEVELVSLPLLGLFAALLLFGLAEDRAHRSPRSPNCGC